MIKAAIFDMDGTILDTAYDLAEAINYAMGAAGHRHDFTREDACFFFGSGLLVAIRRALAAEAGAPHEALLVIGTEQEGEVPEGTRLEAERIRQLYMPYYSVHCEDHTGPYPGIPQAIRALREKGIRTAVVSNKPDSATQALTRQHFPGLFDLAVGERPAVRRKPAPDMTLAALEELGVSPEEAVYVGDTEIDLETAANSGLPCVTVSWGFRSAAYLRALGAEPIVQTAEEMRDAILSLKLKSGTRLSRILP